MRTTVVLAGVAEGGCGGGADMTQEHQRALAASAQGGIRSFENNANFTRNYINLKLK